MSPKLLGQTVRFATVSGSGTIVNLATFWLLRHGSVPDLASGAVAFIVACHYNFALHSRITFAPVPSGAAWFSLRFLALSVAALGVNLAVLSSVRHTGAPALAAQTAGIALGFPVNFIGSRRWVFSQ